MNRYEAAMKLMEERFGKGRDNIISLATIDRNLNESGNPRPAVRNIDAYYADGAFYAVTYGTSSKMLQIASNPEVAVDVCKKWFTANGIGKNLGWVLDPNNTEIRAKLRSVFEKWYDFANNEQDRNCCILEIRLSNGVLIKDHGAIRYEIDFINKTEGPKKPAAGQYQLGAFNIRISDNEQGWASTGLDGSVIEWNASYFAYAKYLVIDMPVPAGSMNLIWQGNTSWDWNLKEIVGANGELNEGVSYADGKLTIELSKNLAKYKSFSESYGVVKFYLQYPQPDLSVIKGACLVIE